MKRKRKTKSEPVERPQTFDAPPVAFLEWWNPSGTEPISGASLGGHPDASRIWARKDPGRWTRRTYGVDAVHAYASACYRHEYVAWQQAGSPEREPFVSIAKPNEQQVNFWRGVVKRLAAAVTHVKKPRQRDWPNGSAPFVEPLDEQKAKEEDSGPIEF